MQPPTEDSPYQLIVEGPDDVAFFGALQTELYKQGRLNERAFIKIMGGKFQSRNTKKLLLGLKLRSIPVKTIALICDADQNPQAAFSSMQGIVASADLPVPLEIGTFQGGELRVGILVLPHDRPGIRETLCLEAVSGEPVLQCVDEFMQCAASYGHLPHSADKARLLAYLAAQTDTEARTGIAVERGILPWDSPAFAIIVRFLEDLIKE